jgi:hypothetical protein
MTKESDIDPGADDFCFLFCIQVSRGSSVDIATGYGMDGRRVGVYALVG